jgi:hypothetical protein
LGAAGGGGKQRSGTAAKDGKSSGGSGGSSGGALPAPAAKLPPIPIGTSRDLLVGQRVLAIGNPFGLDQTLTTGIVSVFGVLLGSAAVALATRSFRWEGFGNVEDLGNHLLGAMLMGVGGVTAMGCTVGQGLSGVSTLAVGSMLALAAIMAGAVAALRYQVWRLDRMV